MTPTVLIIEDGDEYQESLARWVEGPVYRQAHCLREAVRELERGGVDLLYLDMRFDRIDPAELCGDRAVAMREAGGDARRAEKWLAEHQGLFILDELARRGWGALPAIIAHDFSREPRRFERLRAGRPRLAWVPDLAGADEIRRTMERLLYSEQS
jgi:CheY-like chemotaxis protein